MTHHAQLVQLIALQEKDKALDALKASRTAIPQSVEEKRSVLSSSKAAVDEAKRALTKLQLSKKDKELELGTKEEEIKKKNIDLNMIKTNEAYKAMLSELEGAKQRIRTLEDEILSVMYEIEQASKAVVNAEKEAKAHESGINAEIAKLEAQGTEIDGKIAVLEQDRVAFAAQVPAGLLDKYEDIREGRQGLAIVPVEGENCGGCSMTLRPQILNDVLKGQELVFCDNCSRLLYKAPTADTAEKPQS